MLRLLSVGVVVFLTSTTNGGELLSPSLSQNGTDREYLLYVPSGDAPEGGFPLVVSMHGRLSNGSAQSRWTEMNPIAEREGFIVAYPSAIGADWDADTTSEDFVLEMVDDIKNEYEIDNTRVFAAGFSQGGWMAYGLATDHPGIFAAVAAAGSNQSRLPSRPIPVLHIHGTNDSIWGLEARTLDVYRLSLIHI